MTQPQAEKQLELDIAGTTAAVAEAEEPNPARSSRGESPQAVSAPARPEKVDPEKTASEKTGPAVVLVKDPKEDQTLGGAEQPAAIFLLAKKSLGKTKAGTSYLAMTLSDRSGRPIEARVWDNDEALRANKYAIGSLVEATGTFESYKGQRQIRITDLRAATETGLSLADFVPTSGRSIDEMRNELSQMIKEIKDEPLHSLVRDCFEDARVGPRFSKATAAKGIHHATIGGLLEHTLAVAGLCRIIAERYELDHDLLLAGALLHDIGKIWEFTEDMSFDYTDEGRLIGHAVLGTEFVTERADSQPGFPPERRLRLRHMLLSHMGRREWGSPEPPKFLEAIALHYADDLDGKLNQIQRLILEDQENNPGSHWTPYDRNLERQLYRGPERPKDSPKKES